MGSVRYWIWIDGKVRPAERARIPVLDRGFLYGDSVYETLRSYGGQIFALGDHLDRLQASAAAIGLELPRGRAQLGEILDEVAGHRAADCEAGLRLVVTRGAGTLGLDPELAGPPRLIVVGWSIPAGPHPHARDGVTVVVTGVRRNDPSALDPRIKSGNFLNNILAYREVKARGAFEGVLLAPDGSIAECTTSNIFWRRGDEVRTSTDKGILLGVTRKHLLDLIARVAIPCRLGSFAPEDLRAADEVFITSTLKGVLPVVELDGAAVGGGRAGPLTRRLQALYDALTRG